MKPIPTRYKGVDFRSKLEADWAAYFDHENIPWSYEAEGYILSSGLQYLPDFFLPTLEVFVECRGDLTRSMAKPASFLKETEKPLLIAMPQGRFFLALMYDAETRQRTDRFIDAMFANNIFLFTSFQQHTSCFVKLGEDAIGAPYSYFDNCGDSSPDYCGQAPDWFDSVKDRSRADGGDARSYYWAGYSTWQQRGFTPTGWKPTHRKGTQAASN